MKHSLSIIFTLALAMTLILGCKKKDDEAPSPSTPESSTFEKQVEKKWNVSPASDPAGRTTETAETYTSFEFTDEGKYFIIKADKSQLKGDFTLNVGDSILTLDGFGKIYIDDITATQIIFRLVLIGTIDEISVKAAPATPVSTSQNTQNLVNSWSLHSRKVNGTPDDLFNETFSTGGYYFYVTLTDYGTYSIETNIPGTLSKIGIWKWCNTEQTRFAGTNNPEAEPDCSDSSGGHVSFDSNGNLVLTSTVNGEVHADTYVTKP